MQNPWTELPARKPFVLPGDRAAVEAFNRAPHRKSQHLLVVDEALPEPFVGRILDAPLVVLLANPGVKSPAPPGHRDPSYRAAMRANLCLQNSDRPFYVLDDRFPASFPGREWWSKRLRVLIARFDVHTVANRIAVVEWFPYRSQKFKRCAPVPSQDYSFHLVRRAMDRDAIIVLARRRKLWCESISEPASYSRLMTLSSPQAVYITPRNRKWASDNRTDPWKYLLRAVGPSADTE